ncbi:MAG: hypothetical protein IPK20_00490 [Betaproteobacteria bacterium]|nr:hypothetical protein [Betaproteobacteria bacterium]
MNREAKGWSEVAVSNRESWTMHEVARRWVGIGMAVFGVFAAAICSAVPPEQRVAVLEFHDAADLKAREIGYLTNIVRDIARESLPASQFVVLTGENITELLPPGRNLADCVGDCAVQTGRLLQVNWVITGEVTSIEGEYRVAISLFATDSGNLVANGRTGGRQLLDMEKPLENEARRLLAAVPVRRDSEGGGSALLPRMGWSAPEDML